MVEMGTGAVRRCLIRREVVMVVAWWHVQGLLDTVQSHTLVTRVWWCVPLVETTCQCVRYRVNIDLRQSLDYNIAGGWYLDWWAPVYRTRARSTTTGARHVSRCAWLLFTRPPRWSVYIWVYQWSSYQIFLSAWWYLGSISNLWGNFLPTF